MENYKMNVYINVKIGDTNIFGMGLPFETMQTILIFLCM